MLTKDGPTCLDLYDYVNMRSLILSDHSATLLLT
ncbi:unnamed protein product [Amoebophrya sp. A25]|nr:unnamed protein product [Amoebophrya sp. A25]|eukprot:GSA25T00023386001.1